MNCTRGPILPWGQGSFWLQGGDGGHNLPVTSTSPGQFWVEARGPKLLAHPHRSWRMDTSRCGYCSSWGGEFRLQVTNCPKPRGRKHLFLWHIYSLSRVSLEQFGLHSISWGGQETGSDLTGARAICSLILTGNWCQLLAGTTCPVTSLWGCWTPSSVWIPRVSIPRGKEKVPPIFI